MNQFRLRLRVLADDLALFGQMDFDFQVFECDAVTEVAVKPVGLFHDGDAGIRILPEEAHHFVELFPARSLGCLHVQELAHKLKVMGACIFAQEFQLSGN